MTPGEAAISLKDWVSDLYSQLRNRDDQIDGRLTKLEDRANRAEPVLLTRREYEQRHQELQEMADARLQTHITDADRRFTHIEDRLKVIEEWKSNVTGRVVGIGAVGVLFTAVVVAFVTHLLGA